MQENLAWRKRISYTLEERAIQKKHVMSMFSYSNERACLKYFMLYGGDPEQPWSFYYDECTRLSGEVKLVQLTCRSTHGEFSQLRDDL